MREASRENEALFDQAYKGKLLDAILPFFGCQAATFGSGYMVSFGQDVGCSGN